MRIAYFTESLYPLVDGVSRTLARLFATLEDREVEFIVFSPYVPDESITWSSRVRAVRFVHMPVNPDYRVSVPRLGREAREELLRFDPDLIHVVSPTPMAIWAQRFGRRHGIPVVSSFHTHFVSYLRFYGLHWLERAGWRFLRWFYRRCRVVYAPSNSIIQELRREGIPHVELWSRGIDPRRFAPRFRDPALRSRLGADEETPLLLLVSRLVKEKDLADLVEVDRILKRRGVRFRLALVGEGPMRAELEARLPDAFFAGHQWGDALARWFASADVFVFPSTTETLGNVVLEALASGVPAVVVDRGGPQDLIAPGGNGFIARSNDPADLASHVERLLRDAGLRERLGRAARASAVAERSWDAINGRLLDSYERVIEGGRPSPVPHSGTRRIETARRRGAEGG